MKYRALSVLMLLSFIGNSFGRQVDKKSYFVWGWDEISWFSLQTTNYRNQWLKYAHEWIKKTDPNGHLQMPVSRMITCPNKTQGSYRANTKSRSCPIGYSQEKTIKKIWRDEQDKNN